MSDRVYIFDTTLRDGEQVPGCQLNTVEKIQVAKSLELLGISSGGAGCAVLAVHQGVYDRSRFLLGNRCSVGEI